MALTPSNDQVFVREVDEELRRDQLAGLWRDWGKWIITGIVAALAVFAGVLLWQNHRSDARGVEGEQLGEAFAAVASAQSSKAEPALATLSTSGSAGYRAAALFTQADLLLGRGDLKGAAAKFAGVAGDEAYPKVLRDLALIRQTSAEFDAMKPSVVVERLRPLAGKGSPWLGSAGEMVAMAYLKENRRDLAATLFGQIAAGDDVPPTLRQRAVQMAGVLGVDAVATANGKTATP